MSEAVSQKVSEMGSKFCPPPMPDQCCSMCCVIFSLWTFIVLVIMGVLLDLGYGKIGNDGTLPESKYEAGALNCFIAAAIYLAFIVGCGGRYIYLKIQEVNYAKERAARRASRSAAVFEGNQL